MAKFAKLFDVADTQALFMITNDDAGDCSLKMVTEVDGLEISQALSFKNMDEEKAYEKAQEILDALNEESAVKFHAQMVAMVRGEANQEGKRDE